MSIYMDFKSFIRKYTKFLQRHPVRSKENIMGSIDPGRYFYFDFYEGEFKMTLTPEMLVKAINMKSKIDIPIADTPIQSLNNLLEKQDLYKVMTIQPNESLGLISRLKEGQNLSIREIKELNRRLIEVNYPLETPKRQLIMLLQD